MDETRSYTASQALDEVMIGGAAGEVVGSNNEKFKVGDEVVSPNGGWQLYSLSEGKMLSKVDDAKVPLQAFVGPLGMPGVTAWVGLNRIVQAGRRARIPPMSASATNSRNGCAAWASRMKMFTRTTVGGIVSRRSAALAEWIGSNSNLSRDMPPGLRVKSMAKWVRMRCWSKFGSTLDMR